MNRRIQQFLAAENITQSQFADSINVARASVSHIIAGRNKPGFDFIENMARRYPALNLEWLIIGKGKMYKNQEDSLFNDDQPQEISAQILAEPEAPVQKNFDTEHISTEEDIPIYPEQDIQEINNSEAEIKSITLDKEGQHSNNKVTISKIIVLFSDGRYQELK